MAENRCAKSIAPPPRWIFLLPLWRTGCWHWHGGIFNNYHARYLCTSGCSVLEARSRLPRGRLPHVLATAYFCRMGRTAPLQVLLPYPWGLASNSLATAESLTSWSFLTLVSNRHTAEVSIIKRKLSVSYRRGCKIEQYQCLSRLDRLNLS